MLAVLRRDAICEEETSVCDVGQPQTVFAIQALDFAEGPGSSRGSGEKAQRWNGDTGSGVGQAL